MSDFGRDYEGKEIISGHANGNLAYEGTGDNGSLAAVSTVDFDYDEIDRRCFGAEEVDDTISAADAAAVISLILSWIVGSSRVKPVSEQGIVSRVLSLQYLLDPQSSPAGIRNMSDIARITGITRAAVSKALLEFRDGSGLRISAGKMAFARESARRSAQEQLAAGTHSSQTRKSVQQRKAEALARLGRPS